MSTLPGTSSSPRRSTSWCAASAPCTGCARAPGNSVLMGTRNADLVALDPAAVRPRVRAGRGRAGEPGGGRGYRRGSSPQGRAAIIRLLTATLSARAALLTLARPRFFFGDSVVSACIYQVGSVG